MRDRRSFLRLAARHALLGAASLTAPRWLLRTAAAAGTDRTLVCVFLRGGCDGLNTVVPHGDDEYHRQRPSIRIPAPGPGAQHAALDLDGYFGLHPALSGLHALYREGRLAILPAVHYADAPRSHFVSQAAIERAGGPGGSGWLNRYLAATGGSPGLRGLALAPRAPAALAGALPVRALNDLAAAALSKDPIEEAQLVQALQTQFTPRAEPDAIARVRAAGALALADLAFLRALDAAAYVPAAPYPATPFGAHLRDAALLIKRELGLEIACIDFGGWDTHIAQGNGAPEGRHAQRLAELDAGLTGFLADLGPAARRVVVLVMTEFGRTLAQNANGGTDHGNASAWFALGGAVRGGLYLGSGWPGLLPDRLREGRDLAHAVEFRAVFAELLVRHLGCAPALAAAVLPGASGAPLGLL